MQSFLNAQITCTFEDKFSVKARRRAFVFLMIFFFLQREILWSSVTHRYKSTSLSVLFLQSLFSSLTELVFSCLMIKWLWISELYRLWKVVNRRKVGEKAPLAFLYGGNRLVLRVYESNWIFSNIEHEIKHSKCENKCWQIFFCLFGIKVLRIDKK